MAINPQPAIAVTIDMAVPSKKALTSTITKAPVQSCKVPISAEAVPACAPWASRARTAVDGMTRPRQPNAAKSMPHRTKPLSSPPSVRTSNRLVSAAKIDMAVRTTRSAPNRRIRKAVELRATDERDGVRREYQAVGRGAEAEMLDEHHRGTRQIGKEARLPQPADEHEPKKAPILHQTQIGAGDIPDAPLADAALPRFGVRVSGRRKATTASPPTPMSAMAQKMTRQLKNSVNVLPASGARIGETLKTSIVVAISRAASWPVWRSRMIARVITMLAQAPTPWTKRRAIRASALVAKLHPMPPMTKSVKAEIDAAVCGLRDRKSGHRGPGRAPTARKKLIRLICTRRYPPTDRGRWQGRPADTCRSRTARWPRAFRERWRFAERRIS